MSFTTTHTRVTIEFKETGKLYGCSKGQPMSTYRGAATSFKNALNVLT